ncbi:MAG TPA: MarR family transcriptional regulator [Solirubrobacterales bacterium]|jgi:DNA-binding MarR family transcriptional regulator|nr:MarR family transcriptional regulator [Solirubrobacterales bacterium]
MATSKAKRAPRGAEGQLAGEAWGLLAKLVYPPPFLPIAREMGLRPASFGALRALEEPRTMSELARLLQCDNSNVTGIVDGLEERGLAIRTSSEEDRRVKLIALTAEGRRVRARLMRAAEKPPDWVKGLSEGDQRTLRDLLRRASGAG